MRFPKVNLPIFLLALLISQSIFALDWEPSAPPDRPSNDLFADLRSFQTLDAEALASVTGGDLILSVDREKQVMTVKEFNLAQLLAGCYEDLPGYTVPVTTSVVRNSEKSEDLPKDANVNSQRAVSVNGEAPYYPVQIPTGTYALDYSQADVGGCGPGIHIDVYVYNPLKGEVYGVMANDYYVHAISFDNTNGCTGVKENMDKVMYSYEHTSGTKTITIKPNTNDDISFLTSYPDYTAATDQATPNEPVSTASSSSSSTSTSSSSTSSSSTSSSSISSAITSVTTGVSNFFKGLFGK